ncbi:hypothetical protein PV350_34050 [Streptomyces sp. PA03-6a]|nr:hypothetical protein [Streptomyces sp. PA03-6a]
MVNTRHLLARGFSVIVLAAGVVYSATPAAPVVSGGNGPRNVTLADDKWDVAPIGGADTHSADGHQA